MQHCGATAPTELLWTSVRQIMEATGTEPSPDGTLLEGQAAWLLYLPGTPVSHPCQKLQTFTPS